MAISRSELERIAELASLELSEEEFAGLTDECQSILDLFERVRGTGSSEAEVNESADPTAPLREDRIDCDPLEARLEALAPDWREGYFVLPIVPALDLDTHEQNEGD